MPGACRSSYLKGGISWDGVLLLLCPRMCPADCDLNFAVGSGRAPLHRSNRVFLRTGIDITRRMIDSADDRPDISIGNIREAT